MPPPLPSCVSPSVGEAAAELFRALSKGSLTLVCAESCTGGLVTAAITDIPGSSEMLWGGVASYSNECKTALLGVPEGVIKSFGAVSPEVARAMADGALKVSGADIGLAVTGIAGPGGGSEAKPVGLVCFAWRSRSGAAEEASRIFPGDRKAVREAAAIFAMETAAEMAARLA